jgi:hypothetical protein
VLRERAVAMLEAGNAQLAIAAALGVRKNTVHRWLKGRRVAGTAALEAKKRGRRPQALHPEHDLGGDHRSSGTIDPIRVPSMFDSLEVQVLYPV